ncbi:MAG: ABC transporter ATP-binding protein [Actinomycetota bacterium]|nr:ABC transporter ATP-binding protein [Actinomycetota bacterium]
MSARPDDLPAIFVDDLSKRFRLPRERVHTLKERVLHPLRPTHYDTLEALRGVSFAVRPGGFFAVVGRNGSGKSTLLKCMAGIYATDAGRIFIRGRMSTFIELGVGFNPDLPARENVMLNATMLGLSPREARRRFDSVVDFAELGEFTELKLKNYSSGMMVRLAFSVMIQVDADILLIDEVLAVGDAAFQQKCFEEFERIKRSGTTVLLVTHDMGAVDRFCDEALLLEHGRCADIGEPEHVAMRYLQLNFSEEARAAEASNEVIAREVAASPAADSARVGDRSAEILDAWFEEAGERAGVLAGGSRVALAMRVRFAADVEDPIFGVALHNSRRDHVFAASTDHDEPHPGWYRAGEEVVARFAFDNVLAPDRYTATPSVAKAGSGKDWLDWRERLLSVVVTGTRATGAIIDLPATIDVERSEQPEVSR